MNSFVSVIATTGFANGDAILGGYKLNTNNVSYTLWGSDDDFGWSVRVDPEISTGFFQYVSSNPVELIRLADSIEGIGGRTIIPVDPSGTFTLEYVLKIHSAISAVANVHFEQSLASEVPTSVYVAADKSNAGTDVGYSTRPTENASGSTVTAFFIDPSAASPISTTDGGSYAFHVFAHEILHSLGFKHPFQGSDQLPAELNYSMYTVMAYNGVNGHPSFGSVQNTGFPTSLMALDIFALQKLYGVSSGALGDTSYAWIPDVQALDTDSSDGKVSAGRGFFSIWDTDGTDTVDFSTANGRSLLNLNEATIDFDGARAGLLLSAMQNSVGWDALSDAVRHEFTNAHAGAGGYLSTTFTDVLRPGGFTIAHNILNDANVGVENAIGGAYADIIVGNIKDNVLIGNGGDDFIFGFDGTDLIYGGSGNDELRGGAGADRIHGGSGDDLIYYAKDGDIVGGGDGDDVFVYDGLVQSAWGDATIIGGAGNDTLYIDSSDYGSGGFFDFIMDSGYNGIRWQDVETINVGWTKNLDGTWSQGSGYTFNGSTLFEEGFTGSNASLNDFLGSRQNSSFTSVSKATVIDGGSDSTIFQAVTTGVIGDVTGVRGSFFWNGQTVALNVSYANGQLTASLPTGFEFNLDDLNYGHARINASFEVDYRWVDSYESGGTFYEVEYNDTLYRSAGIGVFNAYDHGLTTLVSDAVVLATHNALPSEIRITNDSQETLRPVRYSLVDDHGGAFSIHERDGYISLERSGLFPDGQDVIIRIRAEDGVSSVEKDMTIRMDQSVELAPTISSTTVSHPVIGRAGEMVGRQAVYDANEQISGNDASHIELVVSGQAGDKPLLEYALGTWNVVLARDPLAAEIGIPLTATLTVKDSTGQTAVSNFTFTLEPLVKTINGTNGADYLETGSDSTRPWVINGLDGDDTIYGYLDGTVLNGGSGDDMIYLYGHNGTVNGGDGSDTIEVVANETVLNGGAGADTFIFYGGERSKIVYASLSDSGLDNAVLDEGAPPEMDVIWNFGDTDTIDLSAMGEMEWKGQSTSSTSMLAEFIADENGSAFFLLDSDRDGDYDFGIEFEGLQAINSIQYNGIGDWLL